MTSTQQFERELEAELQFEIMEDYLLEAEFVPSSDEDRKIHLERMRAHFEKLKAFFLSHLAQAEKAGIHDEKAAWLRGERCEACGKEKKYEPASSMCDDCWEDA